MHATVNKDTQLCLSLSARPSNLGTRFHNFLYAELGLDFLYKATTTTDIGAAVAGLRALGIRGCGVSMPFKEDCLAHVDVVHDSAAVIASANTIVNEDGVLHAYNTDYQAVRDLLASPGLPTSGRVVVTGSGGMAKAVVAALRDAGFTDGVLVARNTTAGPELAEAYGYSWTASAADLGDDPGAALLVNVTPVGMAGAPAADDSPFTSAQVSSATAVLDVVAVPSETPLVRLARSLGKPVVTGAEVIALQAAEQFWLYTGVRPTADQVARASAYSRAT
ncbi:shikimate 5-dehydrogenase [Nocardioides sp.]|uniref:shikimate 5-dehydrogenase n=1 Tax=Nocardioides sp. TaxID=35761 RepID=UPI002B26D460|nr:shikimate 5-dehydrogenase [Nocardioides sp.]